MLCRDVGVDASSGVVRATCDLAGALAQDGHDIDLLTDLSPAPPPEIAGVPVRRVAVAPLPHPPAQAWPEAALHNIMHAAAMYREVKRIHEHEARVDAVLASLWRSPGAVCVLDDRFPTVVSCMTSLKTLAELDPAYRHMPDLEQRLALEREALRRSRYLHGLTEAALLKTIHDYGLQPRLTEVVGRGLRDRCSGEALQNGRDENGRVRVLFVGRIERRKGVDTLLEAARVLIEDGLDVDFTFAGPAAQPELLGSNGRPPFPESIHLAGAVSENELHRLFAESDIVCQPSRYESHGIVLIEAMMFGRAIVTCAEGGVGEVVEPNRTALIAPPDDSAALAGVLRRLIADQKLRDRLGAAGRAAYEERFASGDAALRMAAFLSGVVAAHKEGAHEDGGVEHHLGRLVTDVLPIGPETGSALAAELLEPSEHASLRRIRVTTLERELASLRQTVRSQEKTLAFLQERYETLCRIENGGWWQLRGRILPLLRLLTTMRRWFGHPRPR